ncbi:MAG: hypothetical protein E7527_03810 [Ruminococcaceae bacterium]|nr:hypothetical protein [Oscillospiraceae bacterium]
MIRPNRLSVYELVLLPMLGVLMFVSKLLMEFLPNVHLLGMFIMVFTLVYRWKALVPVYIYVFLVGVYGGFAPWWVPNLYIWTVLWVGTMLLPRRMSAGIAMVVYPVVCALHGFLYGALYAPAQALMYGLNFEGMVAWIVAGLPFDVVHGIGNLISGMLILPLVALLNRLNRTPHKT